MVQKVSTAVCVTGPCSCVDVPSLVEPSASAVADEEPEAAIDPYDLAEPIPLLSHLPDDFYTHLSSSKWKDRKELALEPLLATLSSSLRYRPDNYADLVAALAGRMTDANVLCVVLAAQCVEKLARGLRGEFARYKGAVTAPILGKTKEKKQNVQDALAAALDAVAASVSTRDLLRDQLARLTLCAATDFDQRLYRGRDDVRQGQEPFCQSRHPLLLYSLPVLDVESASEG